MTAWDLDDHTPDMADGDDSPTVVPPESFIVPDEAAVRSWSDEELADVVALATFEQTRRAIEACDPDALVELGFAEGFRSNGLPIDPWMVGGIIVCPGARIDKSASSHDCGFVSVGGEWVWQYEDKLTDVVRHLAGPKQRMQSVSLVAAYEGLELDFVVSKLRSGAHQMVEARSYSVTSGALKLVSTRSRRPDHNR